MSGRPKTDVAIPILASLDFAETTAFYEKLGFRTLGVMADYAIVVRDGLEIHFWKCDDRHIAENTACYIRVSDVDRIYRELSAVEAAPGRVGTLEDKPWGMREFAIWDPHGNLLRVGQTIVGP